MTVRFAVWPAPVNNSDGGDTDNALFYKPTRVQLVSTRHFYVSSDLTRLVAEYRAGLEAAGLTGQDMQNLGEGLGDTLRSFRRAVADVRSSIDPEVRTIRAEIDAAQKEIEQSVELAKLGPMAQEPPPAKS